MNKVKVQKGYTKAFEIIGKTLMKNESIQHAWKHYIASIFCDTLTSARYRLPDMDKLGDEAGERFVTSWINKVIK